MWCCRRTEITGWTDRVRIGVSDKVKERSVLHTIKIRKVNWIIHILRRNFFLKHVSEIKIQEKTKVTGRRERRRKQLLDDLKNREDIGN
jgi:hypothetical protein